MTFQECKEKYPIGYSVGVFNIEEYAPLDLFEEPRLEPGCASWWTYNPILKMFYLITFIFNKVIKKFKKKNINYNDLVNSYLVESFSNIDVVKNSHLEKRFFDIFSLKYMKLLESNYRVFSFSEIFSFIKNFSNDLLVIVIFGYGSYLVIYKKLSLGDLIVYQSIFNYFMLSFNNLLVFFNSYVDFKMAYERIEDIFTIIDDFVRSLA